VDSLLEEIAGGVGHQRKAIEPVQLLLVRRITDSRWVQPASSVGFLDALWPPIAISMPVGPGKAKRRSSDALGRCRGLVAAATVV